MGESGCGVPSGGRLEGRAEAPGSTPWRAAQRGDAAERVGRSQMREAASAVPTMRLDDSPTQLLVYASGTCFLSTPWILR